VGDVLGMAQPVLYAGVHWNETARNRRADDARRWNDVALPALGGFAACRLAGIPVSVVTDMALETGALDGVRVLLVADPTDLSAQQRERAAAFQAAGGAVISLTGPDWTRFDEATAEILRKVAPLRAGSPLLVEADSSVHYGAFERNGRLAVALCGDFTRVRLMQLRRRTGHKRSDLPELPGVRIRLRAPHWGWKGARDVLTGRDAQVELTDEGRIIRVPSAEHFALIVEA
jgi:hypothetical protein